jgi:hypothetical protein
VLVALTRCDASPTATRSWTSNKRRSDSNRLPHGIQVSDALANMLLADGAQGSLSVAAHRDVGSDIPGE